MIDALNENDLSFLEDSGWGDLRRLTAEGAVMLTARVFENKVDGGLV